MDGLSAEILSKTHQTFVIKRTYICLLLSYTNTEGGREVSLLYHKQVKIKRNVPGLG